MRVKKNNQVLMLKGLQLTIRKVRSLLCLPRNPVDYFANMKATLVTNETLNFFIVHNFSF